MANSVIPIPMVGGVNLFVDEKRIRDDQLALCKNAYMLRPGIIQKRPAVAAISCLGSFTNEYPYSVFVPPNDVAAQVLAAFRTNPSATAQQTRVIATTVGGTFTYKVIASTSLAKRPQFVAFRNFILIFGGTGSDAPMYIVNTDATTTTGLLFTAGTFSGVGANDLRPALAAIYRNRLVIGNFGDVVPGGRALITMSDEFAPGAGATPTFWDGAISTAGRSFTAGGRDGDELVALHEVMLTAVGTPTESALLALLNQSAYLITGGMQQTTDGGTPIGDLQVARISVNCGCASKETVVTTPYGTLWASEDDVWLFAQGQVPIRVGTNIRPRLKAAPPQLRYQWSAAFFDGFYRLAIHGPDNQEVSDQAACQEQWWLDLRDGPPQTPDQARWFGPMITTITTPSTGLTGYPGTRGLSAETRAGRVPALYGVELLDTLTSSNNVYLVEYDKAAIKDYDPDTIYSPDEATTHTGGQNYTVTSLPIMDSRYPVVVKDNGVVVSPNNYSINYLSAIITFAGSYTVVGAVTVSFNKYNRLSGLGLQGAENQQDDSFIDTKIETKAYDFGDPMVEKVAQGLELHVSALREQIFLGETVGDGGRSFDDQSIVAPTSDAYASLQQQLDVHPLDSTGPTREFRSVRIPNSAKPRVTGRSLQYRLMDEPGYPTARNWTDEFAFSWNGTSYVASLIAPATYASVKSLLNVLTGRMGAATGYAATFSHNKNTEPPGADPLVIITASAGTWAPEFISGGGTFAQLLKTRRLGAMLGYDTSANPTVAAAQKAAVAVYWAPRNWFEIGGLTALVRPIPRRPQ